ncbi:hypothetical protein HZI73_15225 [Vallitalea pronyensis]|uniref:Uncharacterized protein n=1 Tax=Vallitalea pronyensis TaxID=1348613 RepID=A0A8J8ML94_9FIRM|nr:hypothetical protein [Vallitalea pronyensis]QUI23554.1 hypothetical protein HZI73_15225 [Vallitalea pronyensis]
MTNSIDLWMMFKKSITAIFNGPTTSASIFSCASDNKLVEGYRYRFVNT